MQGLKGADSWITKAFFVGLALVVLVDGFQVPPTADPGRIGGILCAAAFLYRAFFKPSAAAPVVISAFLFATLVLAENHQAVTSNVWSFLLFLTGALFLYWEYLFTGRNA